MSACLGITYKADVDDIRESPSLEIIEHLQKEKLGTLLICDPLVPEGQSPYPLTPLSLALEKANMVLLLVEHAPFKKITLQMLKGKKLIDTRGVLR